MTNKDTINNETVLATEIINKNLDAINILDERLLQLKSMLSVFNGDEFHEYNEEIRGGCVWACLTLVDQAKEAAEQIKFRN